MQNKAPANWEEKTLGELCNIAIGKTPSRSNAKYWDKDLTTNNTWLSIADLSNTIDKKVYSSKERLSDIGAKEVKIVKQGTLLLSFKLTLGRVAFAGKDLRTNEAIAQLPVKDSSVILKSFLYYYLQYFDYETLLNGDVKVKGKALNKNKLQVLPVVYPKQISEQERIVRILDEVFENIEKAKQNTLKNLNNAKELFESHLNTLLCYFEVNGKYKHLSELTTVKDGTHESPKYVKIGIPFITQKNIKDNGLVFITQDTKYISEEDHSKFYQRSNVEQGDILISMIGANRGMACLVDIKNIFSIKNVGLIKFNSNINMKYLLYFLKSKFAKKYIDTKSKGGAQEFISLTSLRNFPILYVDIKDQEYIVQQLDRTKENIQKLEQIYNQKLKSLEELKQTILQKAFNGEL